MKALRIPLFVLLLVLCSCLCSSIRMTRLCHLWAQELANVQTALEAYDFDTADRAMQELETAWQKRQAYLHITIAHSELDRVEELLRLCRLQVDEKDTPAFLSAAARLQLQFDLLRETEALSIQNIL